MTKTYTTETGYYILVDNNDRIGAKANEPVGEHRVAEWVDLSASYDVESAEELADHEIDDYYRDTS